MSQSPSEDAAKGYILVLASTAFHAGVPVAASYAMGTKGMTAMTYGVAYMGFTALFGMAFLALTGPRALVLALRQYWKPLLFMGCTISLGAWTFFKGLELVVDPTVASFFGRFATVFSVLLGVIVLKERLHVVELSGVGLAIAGSLVISYSGGAVVMAGMLLIMASGLCFAFVTMTGKMNVTGVNPLLLVSAPALVAAVILAPIGAASGTLVLEAAPKTWAVIALAAFFGDFLGLATFYRAMRHIGFAVAAAMRSTHPVFVALISFFTIRALPGLSGWLGGAVIVAGVLTISYGGSLRRREKAAVTEAVE